MSTPTLRTIVALAAFLGLLLAGCATGPQPVYQHSAGAAIACSSATDCDLAWSKVQAWISTHSTWRIRLANDTTIETFGPSTLDGGALAYQAVRDRDANGAGMIRLAAACAWISSSSRCNRDPHMILMEAREEIEKR